MHLPRRHPSLSSWSMQVPIPANWEGRFKSSQRHVVALKVDVPEQTELHLCLRMGCTPVA
eukprot:6183945-Pleurochrysis_carterae.AAC.4